MTVLSRTLLASRPAGHAFGIDMLERVEQERSQRVGGNAFAASSPVRGIPKVHEVVWVVTHGYQEGHRPRRSVHGTLKAARAEYDRTSREAMREARELREKGHGRDADRRRAKPAPRRAPRAKVGRDLASLAVGAVAGGALVGAGAALAHRDSRRRLFVLPPHHVPGMHVPRGGSSCANCTYVRYRARRSERSERSPAELREPHCVEPGFVLWNRGTRLPVDDARDYCSDWWEPNGEARARIERTPGRRPGGRR